MNYDRKKITYLQCHLEACFINLNELEIIPTDVSFHLQKLCPEKFFNMFSIESTYKFCRICIWLDSMKSVTEI